MNSTQKNASKTALIIGAGALIGYAVLRSQKSSGKSEGTKVDPGYRVSENCATEKGLQPDPQKGGFFEITNLNSYVDTLNATVRDVSDAAIAQAKEDATAGTAQAVSVSEVATDVFYRMFPTCPSDLTQRPDLVAEYGSIAQEVGEYLQNEFDLEKSEGLQMNWSIVAA